MELFLPTITALPTIGPSPTPFAHVVKKDDTLLGIAIRYGISLEDLLAANPGIEVVLLDADLPTPLTEGNLLDQLVLWRDPQHIHGVMCAGRWLLQDGEVIGADPEAIRARCVEAARRLWG